MDRIKIAQWGQIHSLYLPIYLAMECGLFAARNIEASLMLAGNDNDTFAAVCASQAHFGVGDPAFCAMKKNQKTPTRILAAIAHRAAIYGLCKDPIRPMIESAGDLVNTRLACFPWPSTSYSLIQELKLANKRLLRSLQVVESPIGEQFELMAQGRVDMIMDIEPFISIAESKGYRVIYSFAKAHGPYAFTGFYTNQELIQRNPDLVRRACQAIAEATKMLFTSSPKILAVSQKIFPNLPLAIHHASLERLRADNAWARDALFTPVAWEKAITTRENIGEKFIDDIFSVLDERFIKNEV